MTDFLHKLSAHTFKTCCQPYSRVGHKAILKGSNILVFGGTNFHNEVVTQILNINCESYEVSLVSTRNTVPIQSFSLHQFNNKFFLWGGKRTSGGSTYVSNELWKFENNLFTKLIQTGFIPSPRMMHNSFIFAKKHMIIYGGMSDTQIFHDWYALDLETYEWLKMSSNIQISLNLQPKMVWLDTRGVILVSQKWNTQISKIQHCCDLYEFRVRKRAFPTLCKYNGDILGLAIMGGQKLADDVFDTGPQMFSDCWIVNLETYECSKADNVQLTSKYGHEAIFYKDRILLIGGICSTNQFSTFLETIDFKLKFISIDRKLCQACKCIFGLEDFTKPKLSIKCEYESDSKSYISAKLVKKFAQVIRNPIKAFGLLIDNSLNMNANTIEINLKKINLDTKYFKDPEQTVLEIIDNSYGFNKDQILESLFTFGYRVQSCTHDSKFEEELAVRKEYGLNLKLASMRLGKSCLIMINTIEDEKFIGYFSIDPNSCPEFKDRFNCFYYFISDKNISSEINRHIIKKNVQHLIEIQEFQKSISTVHNKILVFDFNFKSELIHSNLDKNIVLEESDEEGVIFDNLKTYIKHLYLKPYVGRKIKLLDEHIEFQALTQKLKKDQTEGKLKKIDISKYQQNPSSFSIMCLYHVLDQSFDNKKITIYSENRLITNFDFSSEMICGVIDLQSNVEVSIGKGSIETLIQEKQLKKYLLFLIDQSKSKRNYSNIKSTEDEEVKNVNKTTKKRKL